ncbi:hypothetical protein Tco_1352768 [Tanacetum coccineum]
MSAPVLVASEVGAAAVVSPVEVLEFDTHSSSGADPSESSPPPVYVAPMVLPFLCSDDSESDTEIPERNVSPTPHDAMLTRWRIRVASRSSSPTTSTPEILTALILPAPSAIVHHHPSFYLHLSLPHLVFVDDELFLSDLGRTFPLVEFTILILNMTISRSGITPEAIEELVNRRVEEALAAYEAIRAANALGAESQSQNESDSDNGNGNGNGGDGNGRNGNGGNGNPNENDRGARHRNIGADAAFAMSWRELMKLMAEVYCRRTEIQKMESEL